MPLQVTTTEARQGTGLFFRRQECESLCRAIRRLEANPHWFSPQLARQQAERFAAERFERELVAYLKHVVASSRASIRRRRVSGVGNVI